MSYVYWSYKESTKEVYMENIGDGIDSGIISNIYVPIIIILTVFSVYMVNGRAILKSSTLLNAIAIPAGDASQISIFEKALKYNSFGNQEVREQLAALSARIANSDLSIDIKQEYLSLSAEEMKKQISEVNNDARVHIMTGTLLDSFGKYEEARLYLERASELSPRKSTILFQLGLNKLNRGDLEGALDVFKRAYGLAPEFEQARIFYALGAIYSNNEILLEEILVPQYGSIIVDDDRLLQSYFNNRRLNEVLGIWKLKVEKNPNNPQSHLGLAAAYLELNQRENSIKEIQNAIDLDLSFAEQGEFLIREIKAGRNP
jgi:tetratricopeptide (TPR) repeat protein